MLVETIQSAGGTYSQRLLRYGASDPRTTEALQDLLAAKLIRYLTTKLLGDDTPPLREDQIAMVVGLLRSGATK
ncbi:hypothetical protein MGAD_02030 [Mycolicibacterium gadium]|uniref:Uncharacterized protein n=1 Tax=Mycolicibacterium gadium TaxID=1794 RepID=A0A7I7WJ53_MYCGU|nr:hypothetical protein MGAD_02030 [Mycolicibacterium gadium]